MSGITATEAHLEKNVAGSATVITALAPVIGYAQAAQLAAKALATNERISDFVVDRGLLEREELARFFQTGTPDRAGRRPQCEHRFRQRRGGSPDEMSSARPVVADPQE